MTDAATALGDPSTDASLSDNPPDQSTIGDPSSAAISDPSTAATAAGATPCTPDPGTSDTGADSSTADEPSDNAPDPSTTALPCGMTSGPGTTDTTDHAAADARHHHSKTDHGGTDPTGDQSAATDPSDNKPDPGTEADREKSDPKTAAKSSDSKVNDSGSVKDDNPVDTRH